MKTEIKWDIFYQTLFNISMIFFRPFELKKNSCSLKYFAETLFHILISPVYYCAEAHLCLCQLVCL